MASQYWIKLYQDILTDPKMGRLSDSAFRRCIELFLIAGEQEERDGRLPCPDDIVWLLRITPEQLEQDLTELERAGIVVTVNGLPFVTNFERRQAAVTPQERKQRQRAREMSQAGHETVTHSDYRKNESVTNRDSNSHEKPVETETDKETETDRDTPPNPPGGRGATAGTKRERTKGPKPETVPIPAILSADVFLSRWSAWIKHRSEIRKPVTYTAAEKQLRQLSSWGLERAIAAIDHSIANGWQGIFEPKANSNGHHDQPRRLSREIDRSLIVGGRQ
jgi:hypothetical protein